MSSKVHTPVSSPQNYFSSSPQKVEHCKISSPKRVLGSSPTKFQKAILSDFVDNEQNVSRIAQKRALEAISPKLGEKKPKIGGKGPKISLFPSLNMDFSRKATQKNHLASLEFFPVLKEIVVPSQVVSDREWVSRVKETVRAFSDQSVLSSVRSEINVKKTDEKTRGVNNSYFFSIFESDQTIEEDKENPLFPERKMKIVTGGIFKPSDEEAGAPLNERKDVIASKEGIAPGECSIRECVASLFSKYVPCTVMLKLLSADFSKEKIGSLQRYIPNTRDLHKIGNLTEVSSQFLEKDVSELTRFDLRFVNADRHRGNLLLPEDKLSPFYLIDNGCILPDGFLSPAVFCWIEWEKAGRAFSNEDAKEIAEIDIEKDRALIRKHFPEVSNDLLKTLTVSTFILQEGVKEGLSPKQIASFYLLYGTSSIFTFVYAKKIYDFIYTKQDFDAAARSEVSKAVLLLKMFIQEKGNPSSSEMITYLKSRFPS